LPHIKSTKQPARSQNMTDSYLYDSYYIQSVTNRWTIS